MVEVYRVHHCHLELNHHRCSVRECCIIRRYCSDRIARRILDVLIVEWNHEHAFDRLRDQRRFRIPNSNDVMDEIQYVKH